uniref:Uncharacterized protein n=1 Tax=Ornithodoros turicata TaxID=34597 RepID=A0A2R5LG82_9ACAR
MAFMIPAVRNEYDIYFSRSPRSSLPGSVSGSPQAPSVMEEYFRNLRGTLTTTAPEKVCKDRIVPVRKISRGHSPGTTKVVAQLCERLRANDTVNKENPLP